MQCIILYIELPKHGNFSYEQSNSWNSIEKYLANSYKQNKDIERRGESCWLIPLDCGLPSIAEAVHHANEASFPYRTLKIDKKEDWIGYQQMK
ncbi:hypothetical protein [Nitrosomonas communis]|uniref:Uncharacterized protein n=1 Tax=Nitrosomonas communis TaxID=44574 RepID=A0A1H2RB46_9PROT|nr:hypothetical protein [Nitrosomonas communis]SDW16515.1 hypothetical protein SAMN05421882_100445 [Nitrosomonas communis]